MWHSLNIGRHLHGVSLGRSLPQLLSHERQMCGKATYTFPKSEAHTNLNTLDHEEEIILYDTSPRPLVETSESWHVSLLLGSCDQRPNIYRNNYVGHSTVSSGSSQVIWLSEHDWFVVGMMLKYTYNRTESTIVSTSEYQTDIRRTRVRLLVSIVV